MSFPKDPHMHRRHPSQPTQTPIPLPRFPGFKYRGLGPSSSATQNGDAPTGRTPANRESESVSQPHLPLETPAARKDLARGIAVMLQSPAAANDYELVDEPDDQPEAPDELVMSDLAPQFKRRVAAAQEAAAKRRRTEVALPLPPIRRSTTPVPVPSTAAPTGGVTTAAGRSRTSTPRSGAQSENRGRPKGWKPGMSYAEMRNSRPDAKVSRTSTPGSTQSAPRGRPPHLGSKPDMSPSNLGPKAATPRAQGTTTPARDPRELTPCGTQSANKGRPKGWKPGMSYSDVRNFGPEVAAANAAMEPSRARRQRAAAPLPGTQGLVKRRGRPPRPPSLGPREIYDALEPRFVPFVCEWEGCRAELHNLSTLAVHMRLVHCNWVTPVMCQWAKCAKGPPPRFPTRRALDEHVTRFHIIPLAWHMGDGPRVSPPGTRRAGAGDGGDDLPRYLLDEDGRQVTPSIRDQRVEDFAEWKKRRQRLKALLREAWDAMPEEGGSGTDGAEAGRAAPALTVVLDR